MGEQHFGNNNNYIVVDYENDDDVDGCLQTQEGELCKLNCNLKKSL